MIGTSLGIGMARERTARRDLVLDLDLELASRRWGLLAAAADFGEQVELHAPRLDLLAQLLGGALVLGGGRLGALEVDRALCGERAPSLDGGGDRDPVLSGDQRDVGVEG